MEAKKKRMRLGIAMLACLLVAVLAQVLQPTVPPLGRWSGAVWQTEFDPESGQSYVEFVVERETYIVDRAVDWITEADTILRTTFRSVVLSTISTIAIVVFVVCLVLIVIVSLPGIKRKQVDSVGAATTPGCLGWKAMGAKRKRKILGIAMLACLLVAALAEVLRPTVPYLGEWDRAVWQTEFAPESGQSYAEFAAERGTYIADRAIDWLTEADATLRTTFHAIILSTISAVAIVVFVICLAIMVIVSLSGIKRKQVGNAG